VPFQQRTNTSCQLALPTRGFTAAVSVFRGTPPPKPLNCKIRFLVFDGPAGTAWAHLIGEQPQLLFAGFRLPSDDIIEMSLYFCSLLVRLSFAAIHAFSFFREAKNPAYVS
jgi:hypothetical protein